MMFLVHRAKGRFFLKHWSPAVFQEPAARNVRMPRYANAPWKYTERWAENMILILEFDIPVSFFPTFLPAFYPENSQMFGAKNLNLWRCDYTLTVFF